MLDAALRVFLERGQRGTSMQAVADAAGVTKPVVYGCFASKDELLLALLDREEQRLTDAVTAALPQDRSATNPEALIAASLSAFLTAATQAPDSWRIVFDSMHGSDSLVARRVRQARTMILRRLREIARFHLDNAEVPDAARKAPVLAELLAGIAESCARMIIVDGHDWSPSELAGYVSRMITHGIGG